MSTISQNYKTFNERGTTMFFQHSGGAIDWPQAESSESHVRYIKEYWKDFEPFTDGWYTNEVSDQSAGVVNTNYQGAGPWVDA